MINLWIGYYKSLERSQKHITRAWNKGMCNLFTAQNKAICSSIGCICSNVKPVAKVVNDYYDSDFYVTGSM